MRGVLVAVFTLLGVAAAQEAKRYESDGREFSLDLPAAWEVRTGGGTTSVLVCDADVPNVGRLVIRMAHLEGPALTARAQAFVERPTQKEKWKASRVDVHLLPLPHVVAVYENGSRVAVYAFQRRLCRILSVYTDCTKEVWARVGPEFLRAAGSARCTLGRYPPVPEEGYKRSERDGFVYLTGKGVKAKQLKRIQKIVKETQKQFVKLHGPIVRPPDEPPLVFVHALKGLARPVSPKAADSRSGHRADHRARRLFTVPVAHLNSQAHADLVLQVHLLLFSEAYGEQYPVWARVGEGSVFALQAHAGVKPPVVTEGWRGRFVGFEYGLDRLESIYESDWTKYCDHSTGYLLLFRYGPSKYRKAYQLFLAEYRATGDHEAAAQRHLLAFDQDELMDEADAFLNRKVKAVSAR
ncbi:MAG: hypothetical protein ACYTG3_17445 [Planctomycetota bacterium]|jgi:hypothetical protein